MRESERCGLPYDHNGDVRECHLHFNHGGDCRDANHQAFIDSLHERTWEAQGPWL